MSPAFRTESPTQRVIHLLLLGVMALALVGYVVGLRQGRPAREAEAPAVVHARPHPTAIPATSWAEFDRREDGPNCDWPPSLAEMQQPALDWEAEPVRTEEGRRAVLAARAARRAFDGAPPTVPHPIDQMSVSSCIACHAEGRWIGQEVWAPMMSHAHLPSCTQCHVPREPTEFEPLLPPANSFVGLAAPMGGSRAWDGAPPTVPHTLFMRNNCLACHGPTAPEAIRTAHPLRVNCLQCHAPSASLDPWWRGLDVSDDSMSATWP